MPAGLKAVVVVRKQGSVLHASGGIFKMLFDEAQMPYGLVLNVALICSMPLNASAQDRNTNGPSNRCGPNALLMLLRMNNVPVTNDQVFAIECNGAGASIGDLRDVAAAFGLPVEVRKYETDQWRSVPLPALVHAPSGEDTFHYHVWYDRSSDAVLALDGTTGEQFQILEQRLPDFWTGYALVDPTPSRQYWQTMLGFGQRFSAGILSLNILFVIVLLNYCFREWQQRMVTRCLAVILLFSSSSTLATDNQHVQIAEQPHAISDPWRDPDHGGVNALYVYFSLHDLRSDYRAFLQSLPPGKLPSELPEMLQAATACGHPLAARQLTADDFTDMPLPAIVHLDGLEYGKGAYIVVTRRFPSDLEYVNGPTASVGYMRYEDFFRRWSGVVLVKSDGPSRWLLALSFVCGSVAAAAFGLVFRRL